MDITPGDIRNMDLQKTWVRGYRREVRRRTPRGGRRRVCRIRARGRATLDSPGGTRGRSCEASRARALLRSTLVSAESAARETKEQARRESDLIVQEAHAEARRIIRESAAEKRRLDDDVATIRAQLLAAFEPLGEWPPECVDEGRGSSPDG